MWFLVGGDFGFYISSHNPFFGFPIDYRLLLELSHGFTSEAHDASLSEFGGEDSDESDVEFDF